MLYSRISSQSMVKLFLTMYFFIDKHPTCIYFRTVMDVGHIVKGLKIMEVSSDIKDIASYDISVDLKRLTTTIEELPCYLFPFNSSSLFLCSQSCGGCFTHFFPETKFAIDINAPVGTPLIAIEDGEVVHIKQDNKVSGIHCTNLFKWYVINYLYLSKIQQFELVYYSFQELPYA